MNEQRQSGEPSTDQAERTTPSGLDAGGHEPAPPSEDPAANEARDQIQDAFDNLEATYAPDKAERDAQERDHSGEKP